MHFGHWDNQIEDSCYIFSVLTKNRYSKAQAFVRRRGGSVSKSSETQGDRLTEYRVSKWGNCWLKLEHMPTDPWELASKVLKGYTYLTIILFIYCRFTIHQWFLCIQDSSRQSINQMKFQRQGQMSGVSSARSSAAVSQSARSCPCQRVNEQDRYPDYSLWILIPTFCRKV